MKFSFYCRLIINIDIEEEQWNYLLKCCDAHYDYKVNSSIKLGGFLYGFEGSREFSKKKDVTVDVTSHQLQLMMKALEMPVDYPNQMKMALKFTMDLHNIWREYAKKTEEINNQLNPDNE